MIVHLRSYKTAHNIIRDNARYLVRNPELRIRNANLLPEETCYSDAQADTELHQIRRIHPGQPGSAASNDADRPAN